MAPTRLRAWASRGFMNFIFKLVPGTRWLLRYNARKDLLRDVITGLTVGVMAVPQSVAFASMAGLPAAYGLYTCFVPMLAYACFGGSRHLAVGPVALVSLLLNDGLSAIVPGSEENANPNKPANPEAQTAYNKAAIQVSVLCGLIYILLGVARLGFICNLVSRPIISSFLTAGAILISISQVKYLLGIPIPRGNQLHVLLTNLAKGLPHTRWPEFVMGGAWLGLLCCIRRAPHWRKSMKHIGCMGPLTVATASITVVWAANLEQRGGIEVIGNITPGLPPFTASWWLQMEHPLNLLSIAGTVVLVSVLEAISIAKALAEKHGDHINADMEILGLAASNIAGAAFGAYPSTGSFARSAVASDSGGRTGLSGVVTACVVVLTLLVLTPVFKHMPMNAMAAIVITGVMGLLDFRRAVFYFKVSMMDFATWLVTLLVSLFGGIDLGLGAGTLAALLFLFTRISFSRLDVLTKVPGTTEYQKRADVLTLFGPNGSDSSSREKRFTSLLQGETNGHRIESPALETLQRIEVQPSIPRRSTQVAASMEVPSNSPLASAGHDAAMAATAALVMQSSTAWKPDGCHQATHHLPSVVLQGEALETKIEQRYQQAEGRVGGWAESSNHGADDSEHVLLLRPEGPLCFANASTIVDQIGTACEEHWAVKAADQLSLEARRPSADEGGALLQSDADLQNLKAGERQRSEAHEVLLDRRRRSVVLDMSASPFCDATAVEVLNDLARKMETAGAQLSIACPSPKVMQICIAAGFAPTLGGKAAFWRVHDAVIAATEAIHRT